MGCGASSAKHSAAATGPSSSSGSGSVPASTAHGGPAPGPPGMAVLAAVEEQEEETAFAASYVIDCDFFKAVLEGSPLLWRGRPQASSSIMRIDRLAPRRNAVKVFTSSTFSDTTEERNAAMQNVYGRVRSEVRDRYGMEFTVVDMRWGISNEMTNDHKTSELCMTELEACQRDSVGPVFISMLGDKYGYRPFPPVIQERVFEILLATVQGYEDGEVVHTKEKLVEKLEHWFVLDTNVVPPVFRLRAIDDGLGLDAAQREESKRRIPSEWWTEFEILKHALRGASESRGAEEALGAATCRLFTQSVTEDETRRGLLDEQHPHLRCAWLRRHFVGGIPAAAEELKAAEAKWSAATEGEEDDTVRNDQAKKASAIEWDMWASKDGYQERDDVDARDRLQLLRSEMEDKMEKHGARIVDVDVEWAPLKGIDPDFEAHAKYLKAYCDAFANVLLDMIKTGAKANEPSKWETPLFREVTQHVRFGREKALSYLARSDAATDKLIQATLDNGLCIVHGTSGTGKTTLVAVAGTQLSMGAGMRVVPRFIGVTPSSTSEVELVKSLHAQFSWMAAAAQGTLETFQYVPVEKQDESLDKLGPELLRVVRIAIAAAPDAAPVVLILDSLDQLADAAHVQFGEWLKPLMRLALDKDTPFHLLLSCLPEAEYMVMPELKKLVDNEVNHDDAEAAENGKDQEEKEAGAAAAATKSSSSLSLSSSSIFFALQALDNERDCEVMIDRILQREGRCLTDAQHALLLARCKQAQTPLYMTIALFMTTEWRSFTNEFALHETTPGLIEQFFIQIEHEFGEELVRRCFGLISAARDGITEQELLRAVSLDQEDLLRPHGPVFTFHVPPVRSLPPLLWSRIFRAVSKFLTVQGTVSGDKIYVWYHRQFKEAADRRYLGDASTRIALRSFLINAHVIMVEELISGTGDSDSDTNNGTQQQRDEEEEEEAATKQVKQGLRLLTVHASMHLASELPWLVAQNIDDCAEGSPEQEQWRAKMKQVLLLVPVSIAICREPLLRLEMFKWFWASKMQRHELSQGWLMQVKEALVHAGASPTGAGLPATPASREMQMLVGTISREADDEEADEEDLKAEEAQGADVGGGADEHDQHGEEEEEIPGSALEKDLMEVAKSLNVLAFAVLSGFQDVSTSQELASVALNMLMSCSKNALPDVAQVFFSHGHACFIGRMFPQAYSFHRKALLLRKQLPAAYPDKEHLLQLSYTNLGLCCWKWRKYDKGLRLHTVAYHRACSLFGVNHPRIGHCLLNLALIYDMQDDYERALREYGRAKDTFVAAAGTEMNADVGTAISNIACVYLDMDKIDLAIEHFEKSLGIRKHLFGDDHASVAENLISLTNALRTKAAGMADLSDKKATLERALDHVTRAKDSLALMVGTEHDSYLHAEEHMSGIRRQLAGITHRMEKEGDQNDKEEK